MKDRFIYKVNGAITELALKNSSAKVFPVDTVLIAMYGATIGACSILKVEASTNQACAALLPSDKILSSYLYYMFDYNRERLIQMGVGGAQPNISGTIIKNLMIPLPPTPTQQRIVDELDRVTDLIDTRKGQCSKLDLLVKSRFVEMFGNPESNPKGWKTAKLSELLLIERGGSPRPIDAFITDDENGVNWIKIGDAHENSKYITQTKQRIRPEGIKRSRYVRPGDFLLSNSMSFGRPYILKIDGCIHDGWLLLRDEKGYFNKIYLYSALSSDYTYSRFASMAEGGVVNNLNKTMVGKLEIMLPPLALQDQFVAFVERVDKSKFVIQKSLEELETLKKALMQQYFG